VGQGVLQRALRRRTLTAIGIAEYPGNQPPREVWWHVRQLQRVDARVEATFTPYWWPQVCYIGPLQPLPQIDKEAFVRVFGTPVFVHVYVDPTLGLGFQAPEGHPKLGMPPLTPALRRRQLSPPPALSGADRSLEPRRSPSSPAIQSTRSQLSS